MCRLLIFDARTKLFKLVKILLIMQINVGLPKPKINLILPDRKSKKEMGTKFEYQVKNKLEKKGYHDFKKPAHQHYDWEAKNRTGKTVIIECKLNYKGKLSIPETNQLNHEKEKGNTVYIAYKNSSGRIELTKLGDISKFKSRKKFKKKRRITLNGTSVLTEFDKFAKSKRNKFSSYGSINRG